MSKPDKFNLRELTVKNGLSYPSNKELIMLILGNGVKGTPVDEIAEKAVEVIASTNKKDLLTHLTSVPGLGKNKALALTAALELGERLCKNTEGTINTPKDVLPYVQSYGLQKKEHFLAISLNGAREVISIREICSGSGNMAIIKPYEVFSEAIKEYASAIILCHNHPSGINTPSQQDIKTTNKLYDAAQILGLTVLDHIIITKKSYFSFSENDMLP